MKDRIKLGISIYPESQDINDIKKYIDTASELGYTRIFASLLQATEDNKEELIEKYKEMFEYSSSKGFENVLDLSPAAFETLGIELPNIELLLSMSVHTIRFDELSGNLKEASILLENNNIEVELNISTSVEEIEEFIEKVGNTSRVKCSHNFYPQRYTGLPLNYFEKNSKACKDMGLNVQAFITSQESKDNIGPWGINEGLCTLEEHRDLPSKAQALKLYNLDYIDSISFGNSFASEKELRDVSLLLKNTIEIEIEFDNSISDLEKEIILEYDNHFRRKDINEYTIRSTMGRIDYADKSIPPKGKDGVQNIGEIYILNDNFDRYKGEVQIITKEMPNDNRKNYIGKVKELDLKLLNSITPGMKIVFRK